MRVRLCGMICSLHSRLHGVQGLVAAISSRAAGALFKKALSVDDSTAFDQLISFQAVVSPSSELGDELLKRTFDVS